MAFWSTELAAGTKEPKRGFRFKILFTGMTTDGHVWMAKTVNKPNFQVTETEHTFLNHKFYFPGRVEWQEISMTLVDPVSPNATAQLSAIIRSAGYKPAGTKDTLETISKGKSSAALGGIEIHQLDAEGNTIEIWKLINPFIKSVKYGDLSYEEDGLVELELGLRYDWAELIIPAETTTLQADGSLIASIPDAADTELIKGSLVENPRELFNTRES